MKTLSLGHVNEDGEDKTNLRNVTDVKSIGLWWVIDYVGRCYWQVPGFLFGWHRQAAYWYWSLRYEYRECSLLPWPLLLRGQLLKQMKRLHIPLGKSSIWYRKMKYIHQFIFIHISKFTNIYYILFQEMRIEYDKFYFISNHTVPSAYIMSFIPHFWYLPSYILIISM